MTAARPCGLPIALLLVALAWLATLAADRAPPAKPLDAAPSVFSGERARALLQRLVGDGLPHPLGSAANAQLRERIVAALRGLGLSPELQGGFMVCSHDGVCGMPTNILARIPGSDGASDRAVLLVAHYDSVAAGPGASDDGAGVAVVLEIARILPLLPRPRQSIIVLLDDGEEPGLLGAEAFVQHHRWAGTVSAAVNLDARGSSGPSLMFETGRANRWLMGLYSSAMPRPMTNSVYYAIYQLLPNDTDFTIFKAAGYQGFNFAFIGDVAHYHTSLDDWRHADAGSMQHQGDNALAMLLALANAGPEPPPSGEAVYFDLFGRQLVRIPQPWILPAALIVLLLIIAAGARLMHLRQLSARSLLWGLMALGTAPLIGGLAGAALIALLRATRVLGAGGAADEVAHPWALELSFAALAVFITALLGVRLQRRAGFWSLWFSGAALCALLALAVAHWLPGASYLALLPAITALVGLTACMRPGISACAPGAARAGAELAALATCVVTFVLLLPIIVPLYGALGASGLLLLTVLLIYSGYSLAALMAIAPRRWQRSLTVAAGLCTLAGLVAAMLLPRYSAQSPQRLNLRYSFDADTQHSQWIADPISGVLPEPLRHAAAFVPRAQPQWPWNDPAWVANAPSLPMLVPQLNVLSAEPGAQAVHYRVHIASARAAPVIALVFSPQAKVSSVQLELAGSSPLAAYPRQRAHGWSQLRLLSVSPQGQDLSFDAAGQGFELKLLDESFTLPDQGLSLQRLRPPAAVASQDGDMTIVTRSYWLAP